ncbi:MAG: universal stress protein [Anaerolineae bacterium]|nr:universal stress protein [Anaerolineae bacterium]MBT7071888.1 universal stress protein [Anaerolineae bacterium]MBT7326474.1 universal stress protein [Anaerolineae bacterium]
MKKKILLVTNGCSEAWQTIEYAVWMADVMKTPLTLLGVVEASDEEHPVEAIFSRAVALFQEKKLQYHLQLVNGETEDILSEMKWDKNTYLFIGPLGRSQVRHWLTGRSFRKIMENVPCPIFYVRSARLELEKVLICFGGLNYTAQVEEIGIEIGKLSKAKLTFLHVVPPVESDHLPGQAESHDQENLKDGVSARILKEAQEHAQNNGVSSQVIVRHGNVVQQILEELGTERYDLVCMGSSFSDQESLRHLYAPNVTAEIAEAINAPILTARTA